MAQIPEPKRPPWIVKRPRKKHQRKKVDMQFYNSKPWRETSKRMRQEQPICPVNEYKGMLKSSDVVDHIIPVNDGGSKLDVRNLLPMHRKTHDKKSANESKLKGMIEWIQTDTGKVPKSKQNAIKVIADVVFLFK